MTSMKHSSGSQLSGKLHQYLPLKTGHRLLDLALILVPAAFLVRYMSSSPVLIFAASALGIIPLAASLGKATEDLSSKLGEMLGGLLNATMGNATELIIAFFALREGHQAVVKASLSGSIIGNVLLVLGTSVWVGGIGRQRQTFDRRTVSASVTMLFIAVIALVMPAVYALSVHGHLSTRTQALDRFSLWTGGVLIVLYACGLLFQIRNRQTPLEIRGADGPKEASWIPIVSLIVATVLIAALSEILVTQISAAQHALGLSSMFVGVVIVATVGNAAEHSTRTLVDLTN